MAYIKNPFRMILCYGSHMILAGPGIVEGQTSGALVELIDINPTIIDIAGCPQQSNLDARSFLSICRGEAEIHRDETICAMHKFRCIRSQDYKYVEHINDRQELYDLD